MDGLRLAEPFHSPRPICAAVAPTVTAGGVAAAREWIVTLRVQGDPDGLIPGLKQVIRRLGGDVP